MSVLAREWWGPRFWKILHTLAEQSGNQTNPLLSNDEADAWTTLLKYQADVMPCALCRQHFLAWVNKHRPNLRQIVGSERREWLRDWLWSCHCQVNDQNEKDSPLLKDMPLLYVRQGVEKEVDDLKHMFQMALNVQQLKPEPIHKWKQSLSRLRLMYGI